MANHIFQCGNLPKWILAAGCVLLSSPSWGEDTPTSQILEVAWRGPEGKLEVYDNSETFSSVLAMNASGSILGMREVPDDKDHITMQRYFYADDKSSRDLPLLKGFTNSSFQALSDDGKIVGYASRAPGNPQGSLTAIVWDANSGELTDLGKLPQDTASHAMDISADGQRIVGYSTGAEPTRMRPCIWQRDQQTNQWVASELPTLHLHNPYLVAGGVVISPDGQTIAACATFEILSAGNHDSSLYAWKLEDGKWARLDVSETAGRLKDINNAGVMAINLTTPRGAMPTMVDLSGKMTTIDLLPEDVSGEALAVSPSGQVYGFSDDPPGPVGGPASFCWADGKTAQPVFGKRVYYSSVNACNAQGQLAGLVDVVIKGGRPRVAGIDKQRSETEEEEQGLSAKTLGFRWTPAKANPAE